MSKRGGKDTAGSRPGHPRGVAASGRGLAANQSFVRIVILATLLLLAIYTAVAVARIGSRPQVSTPENALLPARAEALAARLDAEGAALQGGLLVAREILARHPDPPLDAAEAGLSAAGGAASAIAILDERGPIAVAGKAAGVDWREVGAGSRPDGFWIGVVDAPTRLVAISVTLPTAKGARRIVALGDPVRLGAALGPGQAVAAMDGRMVSPTGGELAAAPGTHIVHGDLHYLNVLRRGDGWAAIDPKGFNADPCLEPVPLMWNRWADLEASGDVGEALRERFYTIVDTAGLDERRTRDWIVTRCMINVGWQAAEGAPPGGGLGDPEEWITRNVTVAKAMQGLELPE